MPACFFFTFPFSPGSLFRVLTEVNLILLVDKTRGFFVLFYFALLFLNHRQALLHVVDYRKVRTAEPRDASRPTVYPSAQQHGITSRSFTLPCPVGPTQLGDQLSYSGARVYLRS